MEWRKMLLAVGLMGVSVQAFGWGEVGHRVVAQVAAELATGPGSFWEANAESIGYLANAPDFSWKTTATAAEEKPTHYFEPDGYFSDPAQFSTFPLKYRAAVTKYGEAKLKEHGTALWRAQQMFEIVSEAVTQKNYKRAAEMGAAMAHYVGDLSQPLHVTTSYDGPVGTKNGIHKFFETTNLQDRDEEEVYKEVVKRAKRLMNDKAFRSENKGSVDVAVFNEIERAYEFVQTILDLDEKQGRTGTAAEEMHELALDRMADGAATLALILARAWQASPDQSYGQSLKLAVPAWVAPQYDKLRSRTRKDISFFGGATQQSDCY